MPVRLQKTRTAVAGTATSPAATACAAVIAAASLGVGCAPRSAQPSAAASAKSSAPAGPGGARAAQADDWSRLTWEERHDRMTWLVHPNMAKLFQRFQGTAYPELTCRSCHGPDAEQVQYKMPHGLPALDPAHMPDPDGPGREARVARFMIDEVTPQMADLLGVAPYDASTGRGFGCFGCHPQASGARASP